MTNWKYVCWKIGSAILMLIPIICIADEPETSSNVVQISSGLRSDSATSVACQIDTDRDKIVGKGVYTLEEQKKIPGFALIYPLFGGASEPSKLLEFARKNPESEIADDALLFAAKKYFIVKKSDQAIDILNTIIERYPHSAHVDEMVLFSQRLAVPQSYSPAMILRDILRLHIREHPNFTADEALRRKAFYLETLGKRAEAIKLLEGYVEKHPRGRWANEDEKARVLFNPRSLRRTDELIYHHLAWLYHQNGDHAKAISPLKQAIKNFVGSRYTTSYHDLLAKTYQKTGDTKQEMAALLQLSELVRNHKHSDVGVEGGNREKFPPHEHWRYWLRVRSPEKIDQRLAELKGKGELKRGRS